MVPDDVYVEQVAWEYYNGTGWAPLAGDGNENPFSCKQEGPQQVYFTLPEDISPVLVNAQEGYYIRVRVIHVANYLSVTPRWLLPFVKAVTCSYQYDRFRPAQSVRAWNNGAMTELEGADRITDLALGVYEPMQPHPRAMYLRFDRPFSAMPLSILFQVVGETLLDSKIAFEAYDGEQFLPLRAIDQTQNLRYTGTVFLYLPEPLPRASLFGQEGCWLRMSLSSYGGDPARTPHVSGLTFNTVRAKQYQRGVEQLFGTEAYEAGKTLELIGEPGAGDRPLVDELGQLTQAQQEQLEQERPGALPAGVGGRGGQPLLGALGAGGQPVAHRPGGPGVRAGRQRRPDPLWQRRQRQGPPQRGAEHPGQLHLWRAVPGGTCPPAA